MSKKTPQKLSTTQAATKKSAFLTHARMREMIIQSRAKCEQGDAATLSRVLDLVCITDTSPPAWLVDALQNKLDEPNKLKVTGKGPRSTPAAERRLNWIDMQRYLLVQKNLKNKKTAGKKALKKQAYVLEKSDELVKSGVWAGHRAVQDSCRHIELALQAKIFIPENYYPGDPEDLRHWLGELVQE